MQYRVGSGGVWVDWLLDTLAVSHSFGLADPISLVNGQTYYFRCRSRDNVGNLGTYQGGSGDTWTTIILHLLFLPVVLR